MFLHGLADRIQGEIFRGELPTSLDCLIELALRVDSRLQQHDQRDRQWVTDTQDYFSTKPEGPVSHRSDNEPMQVGGVRLSREERERRRRGGIVYVLWRVGTLPGGVSGKRAKPGSRTEVTVGWGQP